VCPFDTKDSARHWVIKYSKKIGQVINPYSLRKTFASLMAEQEVSPFKVAKLMGHSSIGTTYKYYVEFEQVSQIGAWRSPVSALVWGTRNYRRKSPIIV